MSVFAISDRYPHSFDVSRFWHGMRLSEHLTEIYVGGEMRLTCAGGCLRCWLHRGGLGAAVYQSFSDFMDSLFVWITEEFDSERRLYLMIARYIR